MVLRGLLVPKWIFTIIFWSYSGYSSIYWDSNSQPLSDLRFYPRYIKQLFSILRLWTFCSIIFKTGTSDWGEVIAWIWKQTIEKHYTVNKRFHFIRRTSSTTRTCGTCAAPTATGWRKRRRRGVKMTAMKGSEDTTRRQTSRRVTSISSMRISRNGSLKVSLCTLTRFEKNYGLVTYVT